MAYVNSNKATGSGVTHQAVALTPAANGNSLLLCVVSMYNALTVTWPGGFTLVATATSTSNNAPAGYMYLAHNPNANTAVTSYDPSWGATTTDPLVSIIELNGRDSSLLTLVYTSGLATNLATGSSPLVVTIPASAINALANDDLVAIFALFDSTGTGTWVFTDPSGLTNRQSARVIVGGEHECSEALTANAVSAGNTPAYSGTFTNAGHIGDAIAVMVAVKAASAGGFTMTAAQGSYTLTGSDAQVDLSMTADQGSYALNGQTVNLNIGHVMTAGQGNYILAGQNVNLLWSGGASGGGLSPVVGIGGAGISRGSGITYVSGISRTTT